MTEKEYIYIPIEKLNPWYWLDKGLNKVDQHIEAEARELDAEIWDKFLSKAGAKLAEWGVAAWDWFVMAMPDIVGYSAILTGAMMILSPMIGKSMLKPLGLFGAIGAFGISVILGG